MPGPVSDAYHPEFSTVDNADQIKQACQEMYDGVSEILDGKPPMYILDVVSSESLGRKITISLTEREWRILRFACERAIESI